MHTARPLSALLALAGLLALGACGDTGPGGGEGTGGASSDPGGGEARGPINVLLVSLDTLRADHLQPYGYARDTSPQLQWMADEGVVFEDCVATANWTLPTHTSLLTGLSPITHGVEEPTDKLPAGAPTLAEPFAAAGYRTAGFWSNPFLDEKFGYARGFELYERAATDDDLRGMIEPAGEPRGSRSRHRFPDDAPRTTDYFAEQTSEQVTARALDWLDALDADEPFFLFLHYNDVHSDYIAPQPYDRMFDGDYAGALGGENYPHHPEVSKDLPARELDWVRASYDGEIRWTDHQLGRVLERLRERPDWEDTLVVVTADHGEGFFERGYKEHHYGLYRELLHIPLIVRLPSALPRGARVPVTVSQADVAPTILDLAALPALPDADGRSLRPLAEDPASRIERPPVLSRTVLKPILEQPGDEMVSMTTPELHAVLRLKLDGRERLQVFDRRVDPAELKPLPASEQTEAVGRALRAAAEALRERRALLPWAGGDSSQPLDPELYERMKGWGYIK